MWCRRATFLPLARKSIGPFRLLEAESFLSSTGAVRQTPRGSAATEAFSAPAATRLGQLAAVNPTCGYICEEKRRQLWCLCAGPPGCYPLDLFPWKNGVTQSSKPGKPVHVSYNDLAGSAAAQELRQGVARYHFCLRWVHLPSTAPPTTTACSATVFAAESRQGISMLCPQPRPQRCALPGQNS